MSKIIGLLAEDSTDADVARLRSIFAETHFGLVVGSGHFPHLEVPAQVNAMIERYLTLLAGSEAAR